MWVQIEQQFLHLYTYWIDIYWSRKLYQSMKFDMHDFYFAMNHVTDMFLPRQFMDRFCCLAISNCSLYIYIYLYCSFYIQLVPFRRKVNRKLLTVTEVQVDFFYENTRTNYYLGFNRHVVLCVILWQNHLHSNSCAKMKIGQNMMEVQWRRLKVQNYSAHSSQFFNKRIKKYKITQEYVGRFRLFNGIVLSVKVCNTFLNSLVDEPVGKLIIPLQWNMAKIHLCRCFFFTNLS